LSLASPVGGVALTKTGVGVYTLTAANAAAVTAALQAVVFTPTTPSPITGVTTTFAGLTVSDGVASSVTAATIDVTAGKTVIPVSSPGQTVNVAGKAAVVVSTAANAGAVVTGISMSTPATLEIQGGGTATLNAKDAHSLVVQLDQATVLNMGSATFLTAIATTPGSTIVAPQALQTMISLNGGDTFVGSVGHNLDHDTFRGTAAGLNGDTIVNFMRNDVIDVTDVLPSNISYAQTSATQGTLSFGGHGLFLTGAFNASHFSFTSDGNGGTLIHYP
jgi:hypothetical protein